MSRKVFEMLVNATGRKFCASVAQDWPSTPWGDWACSASTPPVCKGYVPAAVRHADCGKADGPVRRAQEARS